MREESLIYDGNIHVLDNERCYILKRIPQACTEEMEYLKSEYEKEFMLKYARYFVKNDPKEASEMLLYIFLDKPCFLNKKDFFEFIYRPPNIASVLSQYATFSMIFKRIPGDGLDGTKH